MESIINVEKEIEKVLHKFAALKNHSVKTLDDLINSLQSLQRDLDILSSKYFVIHVYLTNDILTK